VSYDPRLFITVVVDARGGFAGIGGSGGHGGSGGSGGCGGSGGSGGHGGHGGPSHTVQHGGLLFTLASISQSNHVLILGIRPH